MEPQSKTTLGEAVQSKLNAGYREGEFIKFAELSGAAVAITYLFGYLINFFYYTSIGIPEVSVDVAKLKYIEDGLIFIFSVVLPGGVVFLFTYIGPRDSGWLSHLVKSSVAGNILAALLPVTMIAIVTLLPPSKFFDPRVRVCFLVLLLVNVNLYLWLAGRINEAPPERRMAWRNGLTIFLVLVTLACGIFIFQGASPSLNATIGWAVFGVCSIVIFRGSKRFLEVLKTQRPNLVGAAYFFSGLFWLIGILYLSLISFAYSIFPNIPVARGGADYCHAPVVQVATTFDETKAPLPPWGHGTKGVIVYTSANTIFVTDGIPQDGQCDWGKERQFPHVVGYPKEAAIIRIGLPDAPAPAPAKSKPKGSPQGPNADTSKVGQSPK